MKSTLLFFIALSSTFSASSAEFDHRMVFKNIHYKCETEEVSTSKLKDIIENTLYDALLIIRDLNPNLYEMALGVLSDQKVSISCKNGSLAGKDAEYNFRRKTIYLGNSISNFFVFTPQYQNDEGSKFFAIRVRHMIFHEFLHHFGFDDHPVETHNHGPSNKDLVYACAFASFQDPILSASMDLNESKEYCTNNFPIH